MKIRVLAALVSVAVLILQVPVLAGQRAADEPRFHVRIANASDSTLTTLETAGYDVLGANTVDATVDVVVTRAEWSALEQSGWSVAVIDRARPLMEALQGKTGISASPSSGRAPSGALAVTEAPVAAALVPATYLDLDGILGRMHEIAAAHPTIAQVVDLTVTYQAPPTVQGRHMFALKISDNVGVDEDETAMLILAAHHAREISTPVIALEAASRLTAGYNVDPRITAAVNSHEFWIAPIWNPDGYNYVFTGDNFWRKNRRVFGAGVGVDQNRNYPQGWSMPCAGSTSVPSETYKGPSAGSEAETQTLMLWSQAERFAKVIDYHSYGREVLYAYRCLPHPFTAWMQQEAAAISQASGYGGGTRVPSAEGEHYQWQLAKMGAYAFLIETNTEFQPPYQSAVSEAAQMWPGILSVIDRPISVRGHVRDAATGAPVSAQIELLNVPFTQGEKNESGGEYGAYQIILPSGTYDLRFSAAGYAPVVDRITVTATSSTVNDVEMSAAPPEVVVFDDDFETDRGWTANPNGTDTAVTGQWERGDPEPTTSTGTKQLGTTVSGNNDLVTGRLAGTSAGSFDIDGATSIQSPAIVLPTGGNLTLTFSYYLAHTSNSSSADYLRVTIVGATNAVVLQELGAADNDDAFWTAASASLNAFAGQTIRIRIEAADAAVASTVEAGIDDVRVTRANAAPVAVTDTVTTAEDTAATIAVLVNDSDPNGDTLSVTTTTQGAHGSVTLVSGAVRYTPAANYAGPDSFTYTISDGKGGTATGTVNVTVTPVNDAPSFAKGADVTVPEDAGAQTRSGWAASISAGPSESAQTVTFAVTANSNPGLFSVAPGVAPNGTLTFTPAGNASGSAAITLRLEDNGGTANGGVNESPAQTFTVTVTPVNDNPVAVGDTATVAEDTLDNTITVLENDTFAPDTGETLSVTAIAQGGHGAVTLVSGVVRYTPAANYAGPDSFTYTLGDGNGGTATGTVAVAVTPANDNPVAVNDTATVVEDSTGSPVTVLANDTFAPDTGETLSVTAIGQPSHGAVTLVSGVVRYTPAANYAGPDSFSYTIGDGHGGTAAATVAVTVTPVNDAPSFTKGADVTVPEDAGAQTRSGWAASISAGPSESAQTVTFAVTANSNPGLFSVAPGVASNGTLTFTPAGNANGSAAITLRLDDNGGTANGGVNESPAQTFTVTVTPINDNPVAVNDTVSIAEDSPASIVNVLGNDVDVDTGTTLTVTLGASPAHGTLTPNPDGSFTYAPNANFNGTDTFTYTANDGTTDSNAATVTITVAAVNDAPVAVDDAVTTAEDTAVTVPAVANDTDVDGDTLRVISVGAPANGSAVTNQDGTIAYTPRPNFSGSDSFTYTLSDLQGGTAAATVTISVTAVNDAPVAVPDAAATTEDATVAVAGNVLANDTDVDGGQSLTASLLAGPATGTLTFSPDGSFTYTAAPNVNGSVSFTYTANDGTTDSNAAPVTITVAAVNDAPVAVDDAVTTAEDTAVTVPAVANDTDVDGDTLRVISVGAPANGSAVTNQDGTIAYTPRAHFSGSDSFTYTLSDLQGGTAAATVTISVTAVNDAPVAVPDAATTTEDATEAVTGNVLVNDTDVDGGQSLTASLLAGPATGALTFNANGNFAYTPAANVNGSVSFTYEASDGTADSNAATVTITVAAVNDAPVAANDGVSTNEDTALSGNVLTNDSDPDGGASLTASLVSGPAGGTFALNPDGSFTYTPAANFNGSDSFTYTASDGAAVSNVATVTISVSGVNDAPVAANDAATTTEEAAISGTVLGNDTDADSGTTLTATLRTGPANGAVVLGANGSFTYTPIANFNGTDSFTYTASDGSAVSNVATVTMTVIGVNDAPVAANDTASTTQGAAVSGSVLGNDTDVDAGTTLTATLETNPANGAVTLASNGSFTYTPSANFSGTDSFTYTANDGAAASNLATVTITVAPVSNPVVFFDDFETNRGWTVNPAGTDTATTGLWERGDPQATTSDGTKQLGTTVSGVNDLVTGRLAGTSVGSVDIDGGSTSIQSPAIVLPSGGNLSLSFSYYFAHTSNSSTADYLRVTVIGTTTTVVLQELGAANDDDAAWTAANVNLNAFAGQTIRIRIEAADAGTASLVEAAVDDVRILRQ